MEAAPSQEEIPPPPIHVAVIMDGNGRWAKARGMPRALGHKKGADAVRRTVVAAAEMGVSYLTLFGFSSENWRRPVAEVRDLMNLLRLYLRGETAELHQKNVRIRIIGGRDRFTDETIKLIEHSEALTRDNTGLNLIVALDYGSQTEIAAAARHIAEEVASGGLRPENIDEACVAGHLLTAGIPDPDLVIRTSGEQRLSNFLLWQSAYAELVFIDTLWPDFSKNDLENAIREYHRRERRYGAISG